MPALNGLTHNDWRKRAARCCAWLAASASLFLAACGNDDSITTGSQQPAQAQSTQSDAAAPSHPSSSSLVIQSPAQSFNASAPSTNEAVVLAPPVIHTVDLV